MEHLQFYEPLQDSEMWESKTAVLCKAHVRAGLL